MANEGTSDSKEAQGRKRARGQNKSRPYMNPMHYEKDRLCPSIVQVKHVHVFKNYIPIFPFSLERLSSLVTARRQEEEEQGIAYAVVQLPPNRAVQIQHSEHNSGESLLLRSHCSSCPIFVELQSRQPLPPKKLGCRDFGGDMQQRWLPSTGFCKDQVRRKVAAGWNTKPLLPPCQEAYSSWPQIGDSCSSILIPLLKLLLLLCFLLWLCFD